MQYKHNKRLVPLAKQLRKEMTGEERHLWYDFCEPILFVFRDRKCWGDILQIFIAQRLSW